jgi:hypothetical protein
LGDLNIRRSSRHVTVRKAPNMAAVTMNVSRSFGQPTSFRHSMRITMDRRYRSSRTMVINTAENHYLELSECMGLPQKNPAARWRNEREGARRRVRMAGIRTQCSPSDLHRGGLIAAPLSLIFLARATPMCSGSSRGRITCAVFEASSPWQASAWKGLDLPVVATGPDAVSTRGRAAKKRDDG